jgi:hypothetical protein
MLLRHPEKPLQLQAATVFYCHLELLCPVYGISEDFFAIICRFAESEP